MATGGFKPNAQTDFLEEWKAKREKMRAKMLGDIAAATGAPLGAIPNNTGNSSSSSNRHAAAPPLPPGSNELSNNANPSSYTVVRSNSASALKRPEEETHPTAPIASASVTQGSNLKKVVPPPQMEMKAQAQAQAQAQCVTPDSCPSTPVMACNDSDDKEGSPSPNSSKLKEKNTSGPSARKGKGQIEKRKLREKRRSTGVVSIPSNESLDELDDDDTGKNRRQEEELVQANTEQNEAMTADPATGHILETPRSGSGRHKSSAGSEEEAGGNSRQRQNRHGRDGGSLEKRMEELERELTMERQENERLLRAHEDKDDLIGKLKEEIDLLNRDLDDIEDECEQLKQENKTLLKVVGQLTR